MGSKQELQQSGKLLAVNKQILEIKKKIQLSEGQRKALFEESELERKSNAEEIARLKKEIAEHAAELRAKRSTSAKNRIQCSELEEVVGYIGDKTCSEVVHTLDLLIIDKSKQLDLLRYQARKKQEELSKLAGEYQTLQSGKLNRRTKRKIDRPMKKKIRELQNSIHAVQVQWREAEHVRTRYKDIRSSLHDDAARFENNIRRTELQLQAQQADVQRLQSINAEASKMRGNARGVLLREERGALKSAVTRDHQASEAKRMIIERRQELENLEKNIFQGGKAAVRPETDADDSAPQDTSPKPVQHPMEEISQAFETLKEATGGTNTAEVLERYCSQKDTFERLRALRESGEEEKRKLDVKNNGLTALLESLKFAEVKDVEESAEEVEKLQKLIEDEDRNKKLDVEAAAKTKEISKLVVEKIRDIYLGVKPDANPGTDPFGILQSLQDEMVKVVCKNEELEEENDKVDLDVNGEKWLPPPYSGLVRRTPVPQQGSSTPVPPPGSDDEEEVPSRGFMKRQAQIIIDTKLRRKNLRFQIKK